MSTGRQSRAVDRGPERSGQPEVAVREGAPGRSSSNRGTRTPGSPATPRSISRTASETDEPDDERTAVGSGRGFERTDRLDASEPGDFLVELGE